MRQQAWRRRVALVRRVELMRLDDCESFDLSV